MIHRLRMQLSQKVGLAIIFGLVIINIIMEILRTIYSLTRYSSDLPDEYLIWMFLQVTTSVLVGSLPCFGMLLSRKRRQPAAPTFGEEGMTEME